MTSSLLNIGAYSVQLGVLVTAAIIVTLVARVCAPRLSLYFWQAVLLTAVLLPLLQPRADVPATSGATPILESAGASIAAFTPDGVELPTLFFYIVAAGIFLRLVWLAAGFLRLRRIVANTAAADALQPLAHQLGDSIGANAGILLSDEVQTPATIGVRRPLILLPRRILEMPLPVQRAVIAHELVHVKRRDWLHTLFEEFWCALLWFHPAARLLASRLSLAREMVVDEATLLLTRDRRAYAEALLAFSNSQPDLPGVTALIGRRQLSQRISLIAGEEIMSRRRLLVSFAFALSVCVTATTSAVSLVPMTAVTIQTKKVYKTSDGVTLPSVVHEVKPKYTPAAMQQKIQGSVFMQLVVLENGDVGDVRVTQSLDAEYGLDEAAIAAAKQWKFKPGTREGKPVAVEVTVQMTFTLKK